jgi:hypothetical protein
MCVYAGPPYPALFGAVVVEGLDQGALTLHDTPSVCSDTHFENKVHPAVPAVINGWAERGTCSLIVGRLRNEEYEVLPQLNLLKKIDTIIYIHDTYIYCMIHTDTCIIIVTVYV